MRNLTREEFLKMPEGTLFWTYHQLSFSELGIKGKTYTMEKSPRGPFEDFYYVPLIPHMYSDGEHPEFIGECEMQFHGWTDEDTLFTVFDYKDFNHFIELLSRGVSI